MQRVVLAVILREYPVLLTFPALACELFESPTDLVGGLVLARAVRNLVEAGLLHSNGHLVAKPPGASRQAAERRWRLDHMTRSAASRGPRLLQGLGRSLLTGEATGTVRVPRPSKSRWRPCAPFEFEPGIREPDQVPRRPF
jgi:hypothetical protein